MATATDEHQQLIHRKTVESSPRDTADFLQNTLGQKLVAYMVGVSPKSVSRWASGDRAPQGENEARLRDISYVFGILSRVESSFTIRSWFAGMNPLLEEEAPATAIREGRVKEAVLAAKAFASDG